MSSASISSVRGGAAVRIPLVLTRLALGFVYLWAFVDKTFGLGFATPPSRSVLAGASPAAGYLGNTDGAWAGFFRSLAGNPIVDVAFLGGLGAVGIALVTGVALRPAALGGTLLMGGIYLSMLPLMDNPIVDEHLVYILVGWTLASLDAGSVLGLGRWWASTPLVRRARWLR